MLGSLPMIWNLSAEFLRYPESATGVVEWVEGFHGLRAGIQLDGLSPVE